ncbi:PAS domain S-box protein [Noviherbaspirillum aridicola]|uniref:histidine kinase n=1 Tax=Noviherbaspirillum aridicola TaxID=2849687 RepID=A0ABQ4Q7U8_9BURK|nr:PAS domain S-box protein [Noviherbaspirillum aridicola]GIZ53288.1 sensor histidine kinase [Noviherbaspirillum aridicola]
MTSRAKEKALANLLPEQRALLALARTGDFAHIIFDPRGVITDWNPAAEAVLGWRREEAVGRSVDMLFTPEDAAAGAPDAERREAQRHGVTADERWHVRKDGSQFWALGQTTALHLDGELAGFAKILRDRTQERLIKEHLDVAQQAGEVGTYEYTPATGTVVASDQFCQLWGIERRERFQAAELAVVLHPDDRERFFAVDESGVVRRDWYLECRLAQAGAGRQRWLARKGRFVRELRDDHERFVGVCYEISAFKQIENELREANSRLQARESRFRQLAEFAPGITWLGDASGNLTYLNGQWTRYSGQAIQDALQDGWARALHPADKPRVLAAWNEALRSGQFYETEARLRSRKGTYRWFLIRAEALRDDAGQVAEWFGHSVDIHDRKIAEAALQLSQRRQSQLLSFDDMLRSLADVDEIRRTSAALMLDYLRAPLAVLAQPVAGRAEADAVVATPGSVATARVTPDALVPAGLEPLVSGRTSVVDYAGRSGADSFSRHPARIAVPGRGGALFVVADAADRLWEPEDIALAEELAKRAWHALEKAAASQELERRVAAIAAERDQIWQTAPDLLVVLTVTGRLMDANPSIVAVLGWTREEFVSKHLGDIVHPDDLQRTFDEIGRHAGGGYQTLRFEIRCRHKSGEYRWLTWTASSAGKRVFAMARDITDIKAQAQALQMTEEALRQSQKMEAVGQLTGGIAHDFNNHLQAIVGSLELISHLARAGRISELSRYVETAATAARKAGTLTHRLLAFSRRQPLDPRPTDVNRLIRAMEDLLRRALNASIELTIRESEESWLTSTDSNQLENALLNLVINARDAMPEGGQLLVRVENAVFDAGHPAPGPYLPWGEYVGIEVRDTGIGIDREVLNRVFEPFFTTKPAGRGTGLGLSMVYGFVKQSGGAVDIRSEPMQGTRVRIYLPRHTGPAEDESAGTHDAGLAAGAGRQTVVVVEDDDQVRTLVSDTLRELDYRVLLASTAREGLALLDEQTDLLLTDVGLPDMSGIELVKAAEQTLPRLRVLYMTAYAEHMANRGEFLKPGQELIRKPFSLHELCERIRRMLQ